MTDQKTPDTIENRWLERGSPRIPAKSPLKQSLGTSFKPQQKGDRKSCSKRWKKKSNPHQGLSIFYNSIIYSNI